MNLFGNMGGFDAIIDVLANAEMVEQAENDSQCDI
jgi:hypothetical protein